VIFGYAQPVPDGMFILHRCDEKRCVRPSHLWLGTAAENSADMAAKGRSTHGRRNSTTRLAEHDVRYIRAAYAEGVTQRELARELAIGQQTVSAIITGRTWRRVQ
jgi:hypothetical protein